MKKITLLITTCIFLVLLITSCSKDDSTVTEEIETLVKVNNNPVIELLGPYNGLELGSEITEYTLQWKGSDVDNDPLKYDVYFGKTIPITPNISNLSAQEYKITNLIEGESYEWKIVVSDGKTTTESPVQTFKIKEKLRGVFVEWPNVGSAYDIYFGEDSASEKIVSNTKETSYIFNNLIEGNKYYYKIVPKGSSSTFEENYFYYKEEGTKIYNGNILLRNQESINTFGKNEYTQITGYLEIKQDYQTNINNLAPFKDLELVGAIYLTYIDNLKTLYGLHNIRSIKNSFIISNAISLEKIELEKLSFLGGSLGIYGNSNLENVTMNNLSIIFGNLTIGGEITLILDSNYSFSYVTENAYGNPLLENISFESLTTVFGNINLYKNESLNNLNFLKKLEGVYKNFYIWNNDALDDISALSNMTAIGQSLAIYGNGSLKSLKGLENITIVAFDFLIYSNQKLEQLNLNSLSIVGNFQIGYNHLIQNLNSLYSLREIGYKFSIYHNNELKDFCDLRGLYNYGNVKIGTYITGNYYNPSPYTIRNGGCN